MKTVSIHQPSYLPWLGYFNKIYNCDIFVHLDSVPYSRGYFYNRNKIKTKRGPQWLTVPVLFHKGQLIKDVEIDNRKNWRKKHWKSIEQNYKKAEHFYDYEQFFHEFYKIKWENLADLNVTLSGSITRMLDIETPFRWCSYLDVHGTKTELLVDICEKLGADRYLSGIGGKEYVDERLFKEKGIEVIYQDFKHPVYKQLHGDFIPNMSIIDLLFNEGKDGLDKIIEGF